MKIPSDWQKRRTLDANRPLISVVVPCNNEEQVLHAFHQRLVAAVRTLATDLEIVYVDDGSGDGTAGSSNDNNTPIIEIAVSNSTKVNPRWRARQRGFRTEQLSIVTIACSRSCKNVSHCTLYLM